MCLDGNDSKIAIDNKTAKLKCLLHYFSGILREKEDKGKSIKRSVEFIAVQRIQKCLKMRLFT